MPVAAISQQHKGLRHRGLPPTTGLAGEPSVNTRAVVGVNLEVESRFLRTILDEVLCSPPADVGRYLNQVLPVGTRDFPQP